MADRRWSMGGLPPPTPASRDRVRSLPDNPEPPNLSQERPRVRPPAKPSLLRSPLRSSFTFPPQPGSCNHTIMTVIHSTTQECSVCGCPSLSGRLYRCTIDKEVEIIEAKEQGHQVASDEVGKMFEDAMTLGKFGPDARKRENNFLNEITPEQLASYTSEQLKTVLAQRAHVHEKIAESRGPDNLALPYPCRSYYPDDDKPWVAAEKFRCQHQVCHTCNRRGEEKVWASLDGVLNGDILPTLTVGLSADGLPLREVADTNVVKSLGCRAVPLPRDHPARPAPPPPAPGNAPSSTKARKSRHSRIDSLDQDDGVPPPDRAAFYLAGGATIFDKGAAGGLTAVPRTMPSLTMDDDAAISVRDFIFEYEYSEYTLACCTPLPAADEKEARFFAKAKRKPAARRTHGDDCGVSAGDGSALMEQAAEQDIKDAKVHVVATIPCEGGWI